MPDTFTDQLSRLAPTVDAAAGRELFERARSGRSPTPRWWLAAAVVLLLAAGVVGVWAVARDDRTTPAAPTDDGAFEVLAVVESGQPVGTILVAGDQVALEQHLAVVGNDVPAVDVDFGESLVAMFAIAGDGCATTIDGFDVAGNIWSVRIAHTDEPCDDIGLTWTSIVALDRAALAATAADGQVVLRIDAPGESAADVVIELDTPAAGFEVRRVEQIDEPFGDLAAFDTPDAPGSRAWVTAELGTTIDWDRQVAMVATMPDNACPDTLVRFDVDGDVWTAVFEEQATACEDPLLSWLYIVAIDRSALPPQVTFRIPADDVFDLPERTATISVTPATGGPSPSEPVALEPTGVVVPLPDRGTPTLHSTSLGLLWVLLHDDGTVSVLPATIEHGADEDPGDVGPLARLVLAADDGRSFSSGSWTWDARGRSVNGGRENDLVGFVGRVSGGEVEVLHSDAARIPGTADPLEVSDHAYLATTLDAIDRVFGEPIDPPTFLTLSSTGPIWRYLDATLVVEDGVGRICEVPDDTPVPDLATCDDDAIVLDTRIGSTSAEVTTWFHAPILVFEDPFGGLTTVIPLGGTSSRNDAASEARVPLEPIAVVETSTAMPLRLVTETDAAEVPELRDLDLSEVAWDETHLLVLTIEGSGCPISVTGLSPFGDGRWTIDAQRGTSCRAELTDWLNVVPVSRSALPSGATIDFEGATITWP